jgi:hypothetical protein
MRSAYSGPRRSPHAARTSNLTCLVNDPIHYLDVSLKIITFWDIAHCSLIVTDRRFRSLNCLAHHPWWRQYAPLKRGSTKRDCTALHPRRLSSSQSPPWEPETLCGCFCLRDSLTVEWLWVMNWGVGLLNETFIKYFKLLLKMVRALKMEVACLRKVHTVLQPRISTS